MKNNSLAPKAVLAVFLQKFYLMEKLKNTIYIDKMQHNERGCTYLLDCPVGILADGQLTEFQSLLVSLLRLLG